MGAGLEARAGEPLDGRLKSFGVTIGPCRRPGSLVDHQQPPGANDFVDVRELLQSLSVEELAVAADNYFKENLDTSDYFYAKPFTNVDETPDRLVCFAEMIGGLRPLAGMRILDFGAGTGWSTRYLTQLGYEVICSDVSPIALEIAKQLVARLPVPGPRPEPTFQVFDGHRIDLPDASVDRVHCFDAFHHVPNPAEVLAELGRVLKPGGIAGFCEPGPNHSKTAQSQFEMRNYTIIENDVIMADVWAWAQSAGFTSLELTVFNSQPFRLSLPDFDDFLRGGPALSAMSTTSARSFGSGASSSSPRRAAHPRLTGPKRTCRHARGSA